MNEQNSKSAVEDVIIIGGGPAGLAAALYTSRANLSPLLFAGSPPGGQLMLTSEVENYPGFESILGPDLIQKYRDHVQKFGTRIIDQNITEVDFKTSPMIVKTAEKSYQAKAVIIATGAKALWLGLENEQRLRGRGVSACATCDGFFFKDKIVAVVGGGDTAMEEALTLTKFARKVYIIHRRDQFRASKIMQDRVFKNPKIEVIWNSMVVDVLGDQKVEGIKLKSVENSLNQLKTEKPNADNRMLNVDGLFLAIGHKPDTNVFKSQVELDAKGYIVTTNRIAQENFQFSILNLQSNSNDLNFKNSNIENSFKIKNLKLKIKSFDYNYQSMTSVPGVFAAGDCVDYQYRQAGTAVGTGIAAALDVEKYLELYE